MLYFYDIEVYPNCFLFTGSSLGSDEYEIFEISDFVNQRTVLLKRLGELRREGYKMVGFNNLGYDYPVLHQLCIINMTPSMIHKLSKEIIESGDSGSYRDKFKYQVSRKCRHLEQIDLARLSRLDGIKSLKAIEFDLGLPIKELPYDPNSNLDQNQIRTLKTYNVHDVKATKSLYEVLKDEINFRLELSRFPELTFSDVLNLDAPKIGRDYIVAELKEKGITCYDYGPDGRTTRMTLWDELRVGELVLNKLQFSSPEFRKVESLYRSLTVNPNQIKGGFSHEVNAYGVDFTFALGGLHASVENKHYSNESYKIYDLDVASFYPNLAIVNKFYPTHLSSDFCTIYENLYKLRKNQKKGTPRNTMLKEALNSVYGYSNSYPSPFFDQSYMLKTTVNGQLHILKLTEMIMGIEGVELIQVNTDGITVKVPFHQEENVLKTSNDWEVLTGLTLESTRYSKMFIRDVNNYLAVTVDGKVKAKGAYSFQKTLLQNKSELAIPKAAQDFLLNGTPILNALKSYPVSDFYTLCKTPKEAKLKYGSKILNQRVTRYVVTKDGDYLTRVYPPLHGGSEWRPKLVVSAPVTICNELEEVNIDYDYYVEEVIKLCHIF